MKKYSQYNCYKGCTFMCTLSEATADIDAKKVSLEDLFKLEARVELYKKFFYGFSNTEILESDFKTRKTMILSGYTEDDMKEYDLKVLEEINENYDMAEKEYLERITNVKASLEDGKNEGERFDIKKYDFDNTTKYRFTRFSEITNIPIMSKYRCTDDGVFVWNNRTGDYDRVSQALTIKRILYDAGADRQYLELEYIDFLTKSVNSVCMPAGLLAKSTYDTLMDAGVVIDNPKAFTQYLNDLRTADIDCKKIVQGKAQMSYGFAKKEDGSLDTSCFIGLDEENKVIAQQEYKALDKNIFKSKGTVEGFIKFLDHVSKGKYTIDFQMIVAASLAGIVQSIINNGIGMLAPQTYIFIGQTSIGKNLLCYIANNIWCAPQKGSDLIATSDSSNAFTYALKNRLMVLPFILSDIQDLIDREGIDAVTDIVFRHSNGQSGGKCLANGEIRTNTKKWENVMISMNESDIFTNNSKITGGADSRYTIINLNVANGETLTEKNPKSYFVEENQNYAVLGKAFIEAMKNEKMEDLANELFEITDELSSFGVQEKQANSLGILVLTDELARKYKLIPETWEPLDSVRLLDWIGVKQITDPATAMYHMISEHVFKDTSYVPSDDDYFTSGRIKRGLSEKTIFDERSKTTMEVRGRILWQKKDQDGNYVECGKADRERSLLLIPNKQLQDLFTYINKETEIKSFSFDKRKWVQNGWLLTNGSENNYLFKDTFKISVTRPRDSKNRESYYAIVLYEDGSSHKE